MKKVTLLIHFIIFPVLLWSTPAVPYSGKIDINGVNYFGDSNFTFSIYDEEGITHWKNGTKDKDSIKVTIFNGRYTVLLGGQGMNPLPSKVFLRHEKLYIKVHFDNGDGNGMRHLSPDQQITATPLALAAEYARIAESVAPGSITKDMLSADVLADLNRTQTVPSSEPSTSSFEVTLGSITHELLSPAVLADLNSSISQITREMLPPSVLADLNKSINRSELPPSVLADLNRTITRNMLPASVLADLNKSITRSDLPSSVLADLNRTITKNNLGSDVLSDLNSSISLNRLSPEVLAALQITPSISTQPFARYDWRTNSATIEARGRGHNLSYQWLKNGQGIAGANAPVLELSNPVLDDNATYTVQLTNSVGQTTSQTITLQQAIGAPGLPLAEANATQVPRNGLVLWLDANDLNADGLADNLPTGTLIDSWKSKVGDANASQSSEVLKPKSNFFGSTNLKAVAFDGGDYLLDDNASLPVQHIFAVYRGNFDRNDIMISNEVNNLIQVYTDHGSRFLYGDFFKEDGGTIRVSGRDCPKYESHNYITWQTDLLNTSAGSGGSYNGNITNLGIGAKTASANNWEGEFGEILFYNRALSNTERDAVERYLADKWSIQLHADKLAAEQAAYNAALPPDEPETGLLAYYKFEPLAIEPDKVWDHSGNGKHLTMSGFDGDPWVDGVDGMALAFDGGNSMAWKNNGPNLDPATICFWTKPSEALDASDNPNVIFRQKGNNIYQYLGFNKVIEGEGRHLALWRSGSSIASAVKIGSIKENPEGWIHVAIIYNESTSRYGFYLNGQPLETEHFTQGIGLPSGLPRINTGHEINIGNRASPYYRGLLDEFRIYNRSLTNAEIEGLYLQVNNPILRMAPEHNATVGSDFSLSLAADNGPTTYLAEGLPAGLSLNTTTGQITGTLSQPGYHRVFVKAMNEHGTGSDTIAIIARPPTNEDGWPIDIPGENDVPTDKLALWLDANDVDANTSADYKSDRSELTTWKDKSGESRHATQSNNSDKPTYRTSVLNGLSVVRFSSDDNRRAIGANHLFSFGAGEENGLTVITVANSNDPNSNNSSRKLIDFGKGTATGWGVTLRKNGGNFFTPTDHNGTNLSYSMNKSPGDWSIATFRVTFEQLQEVFVDGNLIAFEPTDLKRLTNNEIAESHHRHGLGGSLTIGGASSGGGGSDPQSLYGDIAELMVWKRALTDSERVVVEQYLAQKWGLQHQTYLPPLEQPESGLLGRWTFDEGEGDLVHDVSGNRKHGTMTNMHPINSWVDGAYGKALEFDGVDDNFTIPNLGNEYRTITFWLKTGQLSAENMIAEFGDQSIKLNVTGRPLTLFQLSIKGTNTPTSLVLTNTGWGHIAYRWSLASNRYDVLFNGQAVTVGDMWGSHATMIIDQSIVFPSSPTIKIDDLRVYSRSLSDAEIRDLCGDIDSDGLTDVREAELGTNPNLADTDGDGDSDGSELTAGTSPTDPNETIMSKALTNGLQVHLKFDETNGTTAFDSSGNNRYAELHGVDGNGSTWVNGKIGGALQLDGVDDWGTVPFTIGRNSTVSFWINTNDQFSNTGTGFNQSKTIIGGSEMLGIMFNDRKFRYYSIGPGGPNVAAKVISPTSITEDLWWHCSGVIESGDFKLYINGNYNSGVLGKSFNDVGSPLFLAKNDTTLFLKAYLDDLRIYDRVLSASEIQSVYNSR